MLNLSMGMDDDLKQALRRLRYNVETPFGFNVELGDKGLGSGKIIPTPPKNRYEPTDVISDDDWEKIKKSYRTKFVGLDIPIEWLGRHLDSYWDNWQNGYYPDAEKFLDTMDKVFTPFQELLESKQKKSFTNIIYFDELFRGFQEAIEEITWDGSKDWERTWDGRIYNEILIENAQKIENRIDTYLIKRIEHGLDLTDEMKNFKGYDVIRMERQPISPLPPPATTPEPDAEKSVMVSKIKHLSKEKKKLANALKTMRHKPNQYEMKEIIDRCRFKNGKCNSTKVGDELGIDGETALSWIKKLGLSDYAYDPNHLK